METGIGESRWHYSWKIINKDSIVRRADKSFFKHDGSAIPIVITSFFDIQNLKDGDKKHIRLVFDGKEYGGYFEKSSGRTRIFWRGGLGAEFRDYCIIDEGIPEAYVKFTKVSSDLYAVSFVENEDVFRLSEQEEYEIGMDLITKYGEPNTPDEAESILNSISEELLNKPVECRRQTGYVLSRSKKFAKLVKERAGYVCEVCGVRGFNMKNGELYAESHHIDEIAISRIDNPHRMICVCPTCHRIIHYGTTEELERKKNANIAYE